jgi:HEAT repeats
LLDGFVKSPFPGERLAAVTILQVFAAEEYLGYLVDLIGSEKPFIGYHAVRSLRLAVDSLEPASYPRLRQALNDAVQRLLHAAVGFDTDRQKILREASDQLNRYVAALHIEPFD